MIIEKKTVIKALKTENLEYESFFSASEDVSHRQCSVCAVGAIIRKSLGRKMKKIIKNGYPTILSLYCIELTDGAYIGENVKKLLKNKNYLGALSCYFESFSDDFDGNVVPEVEEKLVEFVRKNFPTRFKVKDFEEFKKEKTKLEKDMKAEIAYMYGTI